MWESWIILHWGTSVTKSSVVRFTVRGKLTVLDGGICMGVSSGDTNCVGYTCRHSLISPSESKHCSLPSDSVRMSRVFNSWHDLKCKSALQNFHQVSQHSQRMCGCPDVKGGYRGAHKSEVISTTKGVCEQIFIISTEYNHFTTYLLIFNFLVISLISVVARKWIIIVWTKYLMFPLFNPAYKQMRHQQFIAHTITQSAFPTVGPELAEGLVSAAGREPAQGSDHHSLTCRPPLQSTQQYTCVWAQLCICCTEETELLCIMGKRCWYVKCS